VKILTWNLACNTKINDKTRAQGILKTVLNANYDVIVLTEFQPKNINFGKIIEDKLEEKGYKTFLPDNVTCRITCSVLIAIKKDRYYKNNDIEKKEFEFKLKQRYTLVEYLDSIYNIKLKVLGVHVPPVGNKNNIYNIGERKEPYNKVILNFAESIGVEEFAVIAGDFNPYSKSAIAEWKKRYPNKPLTNIIATLEAIGWENCIPRNKMIGNTSSYNRLDYIFFSPELSRKISGYYADFIVTDTSYSDHDPLIIELR
jgi:exonuclease III